MSALHIPSPRTPRLRIGELIRMNLLVLVSAFAVAAASADVPSYQAEQIFPPVDRQTHAPGIVECPNGDLLASWYGDRPQSDSAVFGARKTRGETNWSPPFVLADRRGFPDCNTCMMIDRQQRLWLFWPTIVADSWETCLLNFRVAGGLRTARTAEVGARRADPA